MYIIQAFWDKDSRRKNKISTKIQYDDDNNNNDKVKYKSINFWLSLVIIIYQSEDISSNKQLSKQGLAFCYTNKPFNILVDIIYKT